MSTDVGVRRPRRPVRLPERRLAGHGDRGPGDGRVVRGALVRFGVVGALALLLVSVPAVLTIRAIAQDHAVERATLTGQLWSATTLAPLVTDAVMAGEPGATAALDAAVDRRLDDGSVVRVKVWDDSGRIVYSDEERLIGRVFETDDAVRRVRSTGQPFAEFDSTGEAENVFEPGDGRLMEVYTRARAATGDDLVFEVYYPDDSVVAEQRGLLVSLAPVAVVALLLLQLAQLPSALVMARQIQRDAAARRRLVEQSVAASNLERRRVGRDLHDGVIQDLAGLGYELGSLAERVPSAVAPRVAAARDVVRRDVAALRGMLTEIYPADLDSLGLLGAVERLAEPLRARGIEVGIRIPADTGLDPTGVTLLYRVAREALTNTAKHASASAVDVSVDVGPDHVLLVVHDDGVGFDTGVEAEPGHLGLALVRDTVREAGGDVVLSSRPGEGTSVAASLPLA